MDWEVRYLTDIVILKSVDIFLHHVVHMDI